MTVRPLIAAPTQFDIDRYGRRIQVDGFLMEWSEKTAKTWENRIKWYWDAVNTPEGLAGYLRTSEADFCPSWDFSIDPHGSSSPQYLKWPADTSMKAIYRADTTSGKGSKELIIEWVVPWDSLQVDSSGTYVIELNGNSGCGDSLSPMLLTGTKEKPPSVFTRKVVTQIVLIVLLLVIYLAVRVRASNQTRRKGSLHRSA